MESERRARMIAVGSRRGGVGKTTHTVHVARALVERGRKVLIIDLDMTLGATRHLGVVPENHPGSYEILAGIEASNLVLTHEVGEVCLPENLHLIPATRKLENSDQALAQKSKSITLRDVPWKPLEPLRSQYDYVFLDTAGTSSVSTCLSYLAADYFIISTIPGVLAIADINATLGDISAAQLSCNPNLVLLGIVLSEDKSESIVRSLSNLLKNSFQILADAESMVFQTRIGRFSVVRQAQSEGRTLFETHPTHKVTQQYRLLAAEIEERLKRIEQAPPVTRAHEGNGIRR